MMTELDVLYDKDAKVKHFDKMSVLEKILIWW